MRSVWHELILFRWRNLLPWRRCVWCGRLIWGLPTWSWIRWGIPEHCSAQCACEETDFLCRPRRTRTPTRHQKDDCYGW